jgi:hypothetical protein
MSQVFLAQRAMDKLLDLSASLPDERDHCYIAARVPDHHAQQRALTDATTREDSDALTFSEGEQSIERPHPNEEGSVDGSTSEGVSRFPVECALMLKFERAFAVDRTTKAIDNASQKLRSDSSLCGLSHSAERSSHFQALGVTERHEECAVGSQAHYLGFDYRSAVARAQFV